MLCKHKERDGRWSRYGYNKGKKDEDLNNNRVVEKGLRGLVSCVQRHLKP